MRRRARAYVKAERNRRGGRDAYLSKISSAWFAGPRLPGPCPQSGIFSPATRPRSGECRAFCEYYLDAEEKLRIQRKLIELLPEALIIPGVFADLGVIVEVSAFGGRIQWFEDGAPFIHSSIREARDIDSLTVPAPGLTGLTPLVLDPAGDDETQAEGERAGDGKMGSVHGPGGDLGPSDGL